MAVVERLLPTSSVKVWLAVLTFAPVTGCKGHLGMHSACV